MLVGKPILSICNRFNSNFSDRVRHSQRVDFKVARMIASSPLNSLRFAIASLENKPERKAPFLWPAGAPLPFAPPCILHLDLHFTAGERHEFPDFVFDPHL